MSTSGTLSTVLAQARRRLFAIRLLSAVCFAASAACAVLLALLIAGVQVFSTGVVVLLAAIVCMLALFRIFRGAPSTVEVAGLLDRRCTLSDSFATALHFGQSGLALAALQREQAERLAGTVRLPAVMPWKWPKSAPVLAGLTIVAVAIIGARYGIERRLTLAQAPRTIAPDSLNVAIEADEVVEAAKAKRSTNAPPLPNLPNALADFHSGAAEGTTSSSNRAESGAPPVTGRQAGNKSASAAGDPGKLEEAENSGSLASSPRPGSEDAPGSQEGSPQSPQANSRTPGSTGNSGLLSKIRDAVSNLMAKMRPEGNRKQAGGQQSAQSAKTNQPSRGEAGAQNSQQNNQADPQQGGDQASSDNDAVSPGKGAGKTTDQTASAKPGSGMGRQDGAKDLQNAEQLAALGKLTEVIGKRSASLTGDMSIEPQSGPQRLRTAYTRSNAKHAAAGGDAHRDEVPIALQGYVQQYFEAVRKQAAVKTARAGKPEPHE